MRISKWYWAVLLVWMITGLPVAVVGVGFAGPEIFSLEGILSIFTPNIQSSKGFVTWFISFFIVFSPVLLLPLAIKIRSRPARESTTGSDN